MDGEGSATGGETVFNRTPIPLPKLLRRGKPRR
jgi:hypothetical protein